MGTYHLRLECISEYCPLRNNILRKFGIKHSRYAFCRVALVGEKAISLPVQSCSGGMVSYPKLAN